MNDIEKTILPYLKRISTILNVKPSVDELADIAMVLTELFEEGLMQGEMIYDVEDSFSDFDQF